MTSGPEFNRWWKAERRTDGTLLDLTLDDLLVDDAAEAVDPHAFPEVWRVEPHELPITYEFDPTSERDGATITIDAGIVGQLDPATFDWNVPGFRGELVEALIRSLPKQLRKLFVPVPDTVARISERITPDGSSVVDTVRRELNRLITVPLPVDAFDLDAVPQHLRPTYRVVDLDGKELATGKDLRALAAHVHAESAAIASKVGTGLERRGLRTWDLDELPRRVESVVDGRPVTAYPALSDDGDSVAVVACTSAEEQATTMWAGTRRLVRLAMPAPARQVDSLLDERTKAAMSRSPVQAKVDWYHDIIDSALDHHIARAGGPAWDQSGFETLVEKVRGGFHDALAVVTSAATELVAQHASILRSLDTLVAAPVAPAVADVREQLARLLYPGVLVGVGLHRLDDLGRYLRAIEWRLSRLPEHARRDAELMARCRQVEREYDDLVRTVAPSSDVEELAWTLEELRVSSFAQHLRTPVSVSEKRIRKEIHRLARGM